MEDKMNERANMKAPVSFFFTLKHLAGEVESKINLVKEFDSRKFKLGDYQELASANDYLKTNKKEIENSFHDVKTKFEDFKLLSLNLKSMQDLVKSVVKVHEKRIENIQAYLENYGYIRPIQAISKSNTCDDTSPDLHLTNDIDKDESIEPHDKESIGVSSTPHSKSNDKQFIKRTPKIEDIYSKLSESTVFLMKHHSVSSTSNHAANIYSSACDSTILIDPTLNLNKDESLSSGSCIFNLHNSALSQSSVDFKFKEDSTYPNRSHISSVGLPSKFLEDKKETCLDRNLHADISRTPQSLMKSTEHKRTPKVEDIYDMLSENTISLLKSSACKSFSRDNNSDMSNQNGLPIMTANLKHSEKSLSESLLQNSMLATNSVHKDCRNVDLHAVASRTPQSLMKTTEHKRTPKVEDIYGMLSENTVSLLMSSACKSLSTDSIKEKHVTNDSVFLRDMSNLDEQSLMTATLKPSEKSLSESLLQNSVLVTNSVHNECRNVGSNTLEACAQVIISQKHEDKKRIPKCARSLLYDQKSVNNAVNSLASDKENLPSSKFFLGSMPEPPKLLSRDFIHEISNK